MEQKIRASVEEKIKSFAKGDLEHATETFSALWEIANDDGDVKAPSNTEHIVSLSLLYLLLCLSSTERARTGHEHCPLGGCGHGTLQVDSKWNLL